MTFDRMAMLTVFAGLLGLSAAWELPAAEKCGCGSSGGQAQSSYSPGQTIDREAEAKAIAEYNKKTKMVQSLVRGDQKSDLHEAQLTPADSGKSRTVPMGYPIYVRLTGNPASGKEWKVAELKGSSVRQNGKPVYYPRENGEHGGFAGTYVFKFDAVEQGRSTLKMVYQKPGDKHPTNIFSTTVEVASKSLGSDSKATDVKVKGEPVRNTTKAATPKAATTKANLRDQAQSNAKR